VLALSSPKSRVLLVKIILPQLVKKFPVFYRNQTFIRMSTRTHHWFLSCAKCIPQPSLKYVSVLSCCLCVSLKSIPYVQFCPSDQCYACISHPCDACHIPCPSHPPCFEQHNNIWQAAKRATLIIMPQDNWFLLIIFAFELRFLVKWCILTRLQYETVEEY
jgi:hypothetical protein